MEYRSLVQNSAEELANTLCTKRRWVGKYSRVLNLLKEMPILDKKNKNDFFPNSFKIISESGSPTLGKKKKKI